MTTMMMTMTMIRRCPWMKTRTTNKCFAHLVKAPSETATRREAKNSLFPNSYFRHGQRLRNLGCDKHQSMKKTFSIFCNNCNRSVYQILSASRVCKWYDRRIFSPLLKSAVINANIFLPSSHRLEAAAACQPRLIDSENAIQAIYLNNGFGFRDFASANRKLEQLYGERNAQFRSQNPNGRYRFDLGIDADQALAQRLADIAHEEGSKQRFGGKCWRNVRIDDGACVIESTCEKGTGIPKRFFSSTEIRTSGVFSSSCSSSFGKKTTETNEIAKTSRARHAIF